MAPTSGKGHIGGITILQASDLDTALSWAKKLSIAPSLRIEVRPFMDRLVAIVPVNGRDPGAVNSAFRMPFLNGTRQDLPMGISREPRSD
jgi:hypothetical protein